jgi:Protein of unknown function (DUF3224)
MVTRIARGSFDVKMTPYGKNDSADGNVLGAARVAKTFQGDLFGAGRGLMSTGRTAREGSAGYVMIERVRGRLEGREGTFLLQHSGVLTRGAPRASIEVLPDSGTGQLAGLRGRLSIRIARGQHSYELRYSLPAIPRPVRRAR